jgi:hypothetical protein
MNGGVKNKNVGEVARREKSRRVFNLCGTIVADVISPATHMIKSAHDAAAIAE